MPQIQVEANLRLGLSQALALTPVKVLAHKTSAKRIFTMSRTLVRNRIIKLLMPALCFGLTACATTGAYEDSLNSWKGSSDTSLIKTWGPPAETFNSNGHTFLVYQFSRTKPLSVMGDPTGGHGDYMKAFFCTTIFDVSQGQVQDWAIKGNDCKDVNRPLLWKTAF